MRDPAPNINGFWADLIIEELVRLGVTQFCISPGSRSTPLVTAVSRRDDVDVRIHFDERGSAFFALGYGRASGKPAAWITTSGTAVANGLPAVVEAAAEHIPMICLTADRPPELRDTTANQTIHQVNLFGAYPKHFVDLPCPDPAIDPAFVLTTVDRSVHAARSGVAHINCMFREPLAPDPDGLDLAKLEPSIAAWKATDQPFTSWSHGALAPTDEALAHALETVRTANSGLIVAATSCDTAAADAITGLAAKLAWPILPDVRSGMRSRKGAHVLHHYDLLLSSPEAAAAMRPHVVLQFGCRPISKRLTTLLRTSGAAIVVVDPSPDRIDPDHTVRHRIVADPAAWADALAEQCRQQDPWLPDWLSDADAAVGGFIEERTGAGPVTEPGVARMLSRLTPSDRHLYSGNSMPIRDLDAFSVIDSGVRVVANRGASGIDGNVATALGLSAGSGKSVTVLLGDLALLHDLNSLALTVGTDAVVIVINNHGGGIFSFLPIASDSSFERYFGTPHGFGFEGAARQFGLHYATAETMSDFEVAYASALEADGPVLIEVQTDRTTNHQEHAALVDGVADLVSRIRANDDAAH